VKIRLFALTGLFFWAELAFAVDLSCLPFASSSITWSPSDKKWATTAGMDKPDERFSLKMVNVGPGVPASKKPAIVGNGGSADLRAVDVSEAESIYVEVTPSGNVNTWVLFLKTQFPYPDSPFVISTKAYDSMGPATYTNVYKCKVTG
jgi:hypothetical protein